ncbi:SIR2 family protein [Paenibacillus silvae]|uniref:SIR2 family protein n=1 Tax=Paenibacillus silvae TaxID=1325358 RepID=UPI0025A0A5D9|nr:SIR2 family protein [Paenibacillus silvae]MDM5277092.1 SIR2 family protein [Paenibacillus silvae]
MSENVSTELRQHLNQIIESLKENRCAILIGAGFSKNADSGSLFAPTFPTWNELADTFYEKLYQRKPEGSQYLNPLVLAEQVEAAYGRPVLNQLLTSRIPDTQYSPSLLHTKLLSLPWKDIFTTNYDTLLERACKDITGKRFNVINCKEDLVSSSDAPRIIKLHGTFPSHRPFIITMEDYRRYPREFAPFINTVQQSLLENTLCLIGFSGEDPNFNQWIGWIHDNLGLENSPQIYLFSHEECSYAQRKLLDRKKVIVLNISPITANSNPRQKYEGLIDYLIDNVRTAQVKWPKPFSLYQEENLSLSSVVSILRQIREAYPGWLTLPYDVRNLASHLRGELEGMFPEILNMSQEEELSFLYEYDWLREKCLRPLLTRELEFYSIIIERNSISSDADRQMYLSIQLSLLRDLRESGDFKAWHKLFDKLQPQLSFMTDEQANHFSYERSLFALFNFNFKELRGYLAEWDVNEQSPSWILRKSGLLAECGELSEAQELLQNSLILIRRQLQSNNQNLLLLSHESALMSLKGHIENTISLEEGTDFEPIDTEFERRQAHKMLTTDWHSENERFQLLLDTPRRLSVSKNEQFSFDFGRRTFSFDTSENKNIFNAYAFLRFREETGHPFRIYNITNGNKTAVRAAEQISRYSFMWAIVSIARTNEPKSVEAILSRAALFSMTAVTADELCLTYLGALRRTMGELENTENYISKSLAGFSAEVLPQLLSLFCCKCTLPVLDEMLHLLLEIYQSDYRSNYKMVNNWTKRLVHAFTREQQFERITTFLNFPFSPTSGLLNFNFPDPIDFINIPSEKPDPVYKAVTGTETLFAQAASNSEIQLFSLRRLAKLSCNGWLTIEQDHLLGSLLWQDNLIFEESSIYNIGLLLPSPESINPKEVIRLSLKNDIQKATNENPALSNVYETVIKIIPNEVFVKIFDAEDVSLLLPLFEAHQINLISYLGVNNIFISDYSTRGNMYQLIRKLMRLLIILDDWIPSKLEQEIMERILLGLQEHQMSHIGLDLLWAKRNNIDVNVFELIQSNLFFGSFFQKLSLYDTVSIFSEFKVHNLMVQEEARRLIALISQQILWRNDNKQLINAINVICNTIRYSPELISPEIEESMLISLQCLIAESEYKETDEASMAVLKGELRVASARLAYIMFQSFTDRDIAIPNVLKKWETIYQNPNEFSEIRNVIN